MRIYQNTTTARGLNPHMISDVNILHTIDRTPFGIGYHDDHTYTYNGKINAAQSGDRYRAVLPGGRYLSLSNMGSWDGAWSLAVLDENGEFVQLPEWLAEALDGDLCLEVVEFALDEMTPETFAQIYYAAAAAIKEAN
jgi:hypothetical protein